eukprot:TRINITY_DN2909_c0_g1_i1.p1 TRINITY_DN2909_c0_g1~~TRINITY_DN2909_c0_g1_i1.p1  ORF type:complete len:201 (+),score=55.36 TRINITY_DN2909_c0_g1_i1:66-668(+)
MGNKNSKNMKKKTKEIEIMLKNKKKIDDEIAKVLVIGPKHSGKSTLIESIKKLTNNNSYTRVNRIRVYNFMVEQLKLIKDYGKTILIEEENVPLFSKLNEVEVEPVEEDEDEKWKEIIKKIEKIKNIYEEDDVQNFINEYDNNHEFGYRSIIKYFFEDRYYDICQEDYKPDQNDYLRSTISSKSNGTVEETEVVIDNLIV